MDDKVKKAVESYLHKSNFDYALLITGEWGIGKTYFFKHLLIDGKGRLGSEDCIPLYISAGGMNNPSLLLKNLGRELFVTLGGFDVTQNAELQLILSEDMCSILPQKLQNLLEDSTKIYNVWEKHSIDRSFLDNKSRLLLIIDDLERYTGDIDELLAVIHSRYVENGIHVVYLANENRILDPKNQYRDVKEKYIRHTFAFTQDIPTALKNISEERTKFVSKFSALSRKSIQNIGNWIVKHNISNIRTIITAMDCYDDVMKIENHLTPACKENLFLNILLHADFFASYFDPNSETSINEQFLEYAKEKRVWISPSYYINADIYSGEGNSGFSYKDAIAEYLEKGYVSERAVKDMFDYDYPKKNDELIALGQLFSARSLESDDVIKNTTIVLNGIEKKTFPYAQIRKAGYWIDAAAQDLPALDNLRYKDIIRRALKDDSYPGYHDYYNGESGVALIPTAMNGINFPFSDEIDQIASSIYDDIQENKQKDIFIEAFSRANEKSGVFPDNINVFSMICKCNLIEDLKTLNNRGIANLSDALRGAWCLHIDEQKADMQMVKEAFENQLKQGEITDQYAIKQRQKLIQELDTAIIS